MQRDEPPDTSRSAYQSYLKDHERQERDWRKNRTKLTGPMVTGTQYAGGPGQAASYDDWKKAQMRYYTPPEKVTQKKTPAPTSKMDNPGTPGLGGMETPDDVDAVDIGGNPVVTATRKNSPGATRRPFRRQPLPLLGGEATFMPRLLGTVGRLFGQ